jgi:hypothetical protein
MDNLCPYIPKSGINKGIKCNKEIRKNDFCNNHLTAGLNVNNKHYCKHIFMKGQNKNIVCNKLIHLIYEVCPAHKQNKTLAENREHYIKNREAIGKRQRKYYVRHKDEIRERFKTYYQKNKSRILNHMKVKYKLKLQKNLELKSQKNIKPIIKKKEALACDLSTILEFD